MTRRRASGPPPALSILAVFLLVASGGHLAWAVLSPEASWWWVLPSLGMQFLAVYTLHCLWVVAFERGWAQGPSGELLVLIERLVARTTENLRRFALLPAHAEVDEGAVEVAIMVYDKIDWSADPGVIGDQLGEVADLLGYSGRRRELWMDNHLLRSFLRSSENDS